MSWIDYLSSVDTPTLANAIELLNVRPHEDGFTPMGIRCLFPELGLMCGYAVTAQVESVTSMEPRDNATFIDLYRTVEASRKPAVIVLQEIGGHRDSAVHCGEVMATVFTRLGAVGLVSDCAVRDIPEVRGMGFRYFARGTAASHANYRIARVGGPVQIEGMVVQPGDILHGDENGLLLIPPGLEKTLPAMVDDVRTREAELMEYVRGDAFTLDGLRDRIVE
jgi:regulator of RNase E activity RraA